MEINFEWFENLKDLKIVHDLVYLDLHYSVRIAVWIKRSRENRPRMFGRDQIDKHLKGQNDKLQHEMRILVFPILLYGSET